MCEDFCFYLKLARPISANLGRRFSNEMADFGVKFKRRIARSVAKQEDCSLEGLMLSDWPSNQPAGGMLFMLIYFVLQIRLTATTRSTCRTRTGLSRFLRWRRRPRSLPCRGTKTWTERRERSCSGVVGWRLGGWLGRLELLNAGFHLLKEWTDTFWSDRHRKKTRSWPWPCGSTTNCTIYRYGKGGMENTHWGLRRRTNRLLYLYIYTVYILIISLSIDI